MLQPRTYEGRPLWGRAVYTALHGARLSSVPSGDQSANPASVSGRSGLQRAFLSVSSAQKCSGAGRLATPSGVSRAARSAVPCRSSAPGHRASRSKYTRDQSRETGSLSRLFGSMETAAKCVSMGHAHCRTRLCGALPQPFYGVTPMLVGPEQALVMEQEVTTLLREETIEVVPALDKSPGSTAVLHCAWERGCVRLRSKLTEPLSHTTEVQKALFKHVSHTRSEDWWSRAI